VDAILCERRRYVDKPFTHAHFYGQLIIPIYGSLIVSVCQKASGEEENVIFIPPGCTHSFYAKTSNQFFVFDIPVFYLPKEIGEVTRSYQFNGRWQAVRSLLFEEVGSMPVTNQRLADLFRYISGLLNEEQTSTSFDYIGKNFDKPITVQQLAQMEHFNPTYYVEWFKQRFGTSPISYMRGLRLVKAKELLANTHYTVMQIAQQIGYENQATLTRLFQKEIGMTPRAYRKQYRK
jgi:AraC-like DNA-binding protein